MKLRDTDGRLKQKLSNVEEKELTGVFEDDLSQIQEAFLYPLNRDFHVRSLYVDDLKSDAVLMYLEGVADTEVIDHDIVASLANLDHEEVQKNSYQWFRHIPQQATDIQTLDEAVTAIVNGGSLLLIRCCNRIISIDTAKFEHRGIEKPQSENVLKGPMEAFVEMGTVNRSLIRRNLRNPNLVGERMMIGEKSKVDVSIMYVHGLANRTLVESVKKRINDIVVDHIQNISILEQYIEERPYSLVPSVLYTERPDRCAAFLQEGHVVLVMDNSPACLVVPVTIWSFFHTGEDYYQRWAFGNFIRIIRFIGLFVSLLTPSLYIAITNYHIEMFPTDLVLAITATRENVPFPAIIEVLFMELAFELLREAGVRVPNPIGPTIGIVGALILGQAAVEANIVSPILVIVVAMTGLASFTVPDVSFGFTIRISRFIFLFFASILGFLGIGVVFTMILAYASTSRSFGVAFLAPLSPHFPSSKDLIIRPPMWKQWLLPQHVQPQQEIRKKAPVKRFER